MTHKEFTFWLKGIMDVNDSKPTKKIWKLIQDKLKQVEDESEIRQDEGTYIIPKSPEYPQKPEVPNPTGPPQIWC
tara:strand:+ start:394 stop:618 length:225 start_codon:yes stop_codon:yes gene_type:complete